MRAWESESGLLAIPGGVTRAADAPKKAAAVRAGARNAGTGNDTLRVHAKDPVMNSIVYLVGAVVIIVALLSFLGLR